MRKVLFLLAVAVTSSAVVAQPLIYTRSIPNAASF